MRQLFLIPGLTFAALSGVFHVYIFYLESIVWIKPQTWKSFKVDSQESAEIIRPMALNQGFYNLFLAIEILIGFVLLPSYSTIGYALLVFATSSISAAAAVLLVSVKGSKRAALLQGVPALAGLILTTVGLLIK